MAAFVHVDRELLRGVQRGELPPEILSRVGLRHLLELCPHCRHEALVFQKEISGDAYGEILVLQEMLKRQIPELWEEHRRADRDFAALMALPAAERIAKVERSRRRFRGAHLAQLILEECASCFTIDPAHARHLAELARAVIQYSARISGVFELMTLATSYLANACRVEGRFRESDERYGQVHYLVSQYAVTDTEILARLADFEGSLRKDQRRFTQAEELLRRSITLYRVSDRTGEIPRILLNLGDLFYVQGLLQKAIQATQTALDQLQVEPQSRLYMMGRYNLTLQLADAGRPQEAAMLLAEDEALYRRFPEPWTQLRVLGVQGRIAAGLGHRERAIELLSEARDGFIRQGNGDEAAVEFLERALRDVYAKTT
jgi:tetratricopeptide (TPR) repeat protein